MKTFAALTVFAALAATARAQDAEFNYFDSWNAFGVGTTIVMETKSTMMNSTQTMTLEKKEEKVLTVKVTTVAKIKGMDDQTSTAPMEIKKEEAKGPGTYECPMCKKKHKSDTSKPTKEKVKVGDKELDCSLTESTTYDCDGKESAKVKSWMSKDVPGGMVKMESKGQMMGQAYETTMTLTKFEKK